MSCSSWLKLPIITLAQNRRGLFSYDCIAVCIRLSDCRKVLIDGVILRDPDVWCLTTLGCAEIDINNVKLIGLWRYNSDGIDICNSQNVTISNCFIRSYDDSIALKGLKWKGHPFSDRPVSNVVVSGCVIWNDWDRALEIGAETCAPEFTDTVFRDCDIIRTSYIAMDIQHGGRETVHNILFEDIRLEIDDVNYKLLIQKDPDEKFVPDSDFCPSLLVVEIQETGWNVDEQQGTVDNVTFRNIHVTGKPFPPSRIEGFDADHQVKNVTIENLRVNGRLIKTLQEANVDIGPFVQDVRLIAP